LVISLSEGMNPTFFLTRQCRSFAGGPTEQELEEVARWVRAATDVGKGGRLSAAVRQPDVCEVLHSAGVTEAVGARLQTG
jgi:hypothetical protein